MVQKKRTVVTTNLDLDFLRTLVSAEDLGGMNRAAEQVGRSQSAVSQQMRKLEEKIGQRLFRKQGRGLLLTEPGELLLKYARRMLALNDEAIAALRGSGLEGVVRFGLPSDFAETWLPAVLGQFKRAHPLIRVEASVDRNTVPMVWIGSAEHAWDPAEPVPLVLFEAPCVFRKAGIAALDAAGIPWRIAFTSPSLAGLWAAVAAGLGISPRTTVHLPDWLTLLGKSHKLPKLPSVDLSLYDCGRPLTPAAMRLKEILTDTIPAGLSESRRPSPAVRLVRSGG
jgi:DNA-binding transcriptional LysR family regulator